MIDLLSIVQTAPSNPVESQHWVPLCWEWAKTHTHIWSTGILALIVLARYRKERVVPTLQQLVEIFGYGAGIYSGTQVLKMGLMKDSDADGGIAWPLVNSGLVIIVAMLVGLTKILREIRPVNAVPTPPNPIAPLQIPAAVPAQVPAPPEQAT